MCGCSNRFHTIDVLDAWPPTVTKGPETTLNVTNEGLKATSSGRTMGQTYCTK